MAQRFGPARWSSGEWSRGSNNWSSTDAWSGGSGERAHEGWRKAEWRTRSTASRSQDGPGGVVTAPPRDEPVWAKWTAVPNQESFTRNVEAVRVAGPPGAAYSKCNRRSVWKAVKGFTSGKVRTLMKLLDKTPASLFDIQRHLDEQCSIDGYNAARLKSESHHRANGAPGTRHSPPLAPHEITFARKICKLMWELKKMTLFRLTAIGERMLL